MESFLFAEVARDFLCFGNMKRIFLNIIRKVDQNDPLETAGPGILKQAAFCCLRDLENTARSCHYSEVARTIQKIIEEAKQEEPDVSKLEFLFFRQLKDKLETIVDRSRYVENERWPGFEEKGQGRREEYQEQI